MGRRPRGHGAGVDKVLKAAETTIDFLNDLNRSQLYHPADPDGDPCLPQGYSEFDLFEADGQARPGSFFKIAHGSLGGPGSSATYGSGAAQFGAPIQRELLTSLDIQNLSRSDMGTTFQVADDFRPSPTSPFDDLRDNGIFTADADVHLLQHKRVELADLCRDLSTRKGRRTGEAMQLIANCMMMGVSHLLLPDGPMRAVLRQLLSEDKAPLDEDMLAGITLSYHQWQVPLFDIARLPAAGSPFEPFDTVATLFTFAKAPEDADEERALLLAIPNHLVAAVQRFTDACAGRENSHFGNEHDAVARMVEHMVQEVRDEASLRKWAEERDNHAAAGLRNSNTALLAAHAIVDAFLAKKGYAPVPDGVKDIFVDLFFKSGYWRTPDNRLHVLQRYPRPGSPPSPRKAAGIETAGDGGNFKSLIRAWLFQSGPLSRSAASIAEFEPRQPLPVSKQGCVHIVCGLVNASKTKGKGSSFFGLDARLLRAQTRLRKEPAMSVTRYVILRYLYLTPPIRRRRLRRELRRLHIGSEAILEARSCRNLS